MPYSIEQAEDGQWCVYNDDTKKKVGTYADRTAAMKKMRALYRADDGAGSKKEDDPKKKVEKTEPEDDEDYDE